jgi:flagellar biosynthetic protein FliR
MLEDFLISRFVVFTFVLARTGALVMTAPIFGSLALPRRIRGMLAVALALLVTPIYVGGYSEPVAGLAEFARLLAGEALVGLLLGLGISVLLSGVQVAGQVVSQMSGLSLADVFNPGFEEDASVFSQLFYFVTLAVFVAVGGHRILTEALLDTFAWAPPGRAALGDNFLDVLVAIISQSFVLGIRAAAPIMIALLLATLVLGLISRTLPQINIIAVGFGVNALLTLGLLFLCLGVVAWTFQEPATHAVRELQGAVGWVGKG